MENKTFSDYESGQEEQRRIVRKVGKSHLNKWTVKTSRKNRKKEKVKWFIKILGLKLPMVAHGWAI
jgi:hypothetical protein